MKTRKLILPVFAASSLAICMAAPALAQDQAAAPAATPAEVAPPPAVTAAKPVMPGPQKIVSLLIAQREGQAILGHDLHAALEAQRLGLFDS